MSGTLTCSFCQQPIDPQQTPVPVPVPVMYDAHWPEAEISPEVDAWWVGTCRFLDENGENVVILDERELKEQITTAEHLHRIYS
jgi:hypothetical protein